MRSTGNSVLAPACHPRGTICAILANIQENASGEPMSEDEIAKVNLVPTTTTLATMLDKTKLGSVLGVLLVRGLGPIADWFGSWASARVALKQARVNEEIQELQAKSQAHRRVEEKMLDLLIQKLENDQQQMLSTPIEENTSDFRSISPLFERAQSQVYLQQAINFIEVIRQGIKSLPPGEAFTQPSPDWVERFNERAKRAAHNEVRRLFGRALARELTTPGSIAYTRSVTR